MKVEAYKRLACGWPRGLRWEKGFKVRLGPGSVPEPPHVVVLVGEEAVRVVAAVLVVAKATAEDSSCFAPWQRAAEAAHHLLLRAHVARAGAAHRASLVPGTDGRRPSEGRRPETQRSRRKSPRARQAGKCSGRGAAEKGTTKGAETRGEDGAPWDPVARCAGAEAVVRAGIQSGVGAASSPPPPRHHATAREARWIFEALALARYHRAGRPDPSLGSCVLHRRQARWGPLGMMNNIPFNWQSNPKTKIFIV